MLPVTLVIEDFFGFRHHEFDFADVHVAVLVGKNGSGKSSVFDAFRWCLTGHYRETGGDLFIRRRAPMARVTMTFTARGETWKVVREKPRDKNGTLHLYVDGPTGWAEQTRHTMAETQKAIDAIVGLSYAGLMAGPLMVQDDKRGDLMRLDPRDRKNLIIEEADISGYEAMFKDAEQRQKEYGDSARGLSALLETYRTEAALIEPRRVTLEEARAYHAALMERQSLANDQVTEGRIVVGALEEKVKADDALAERLRSLTNALSQATEDVARHEEQAAKHRLALTATLDEPTVSAPPDEALEALRARVADVNAAAIRRAELVATKAAKNREVAQFSDEGDLDVPCHAEGIYASCQLLAGRVWSPERKEAFRNEYRALAAEIESLDVVVAEQGNLTSDMRDLEREARTYATTMATYRANVTALERARETAQSNLDQTLLSLERAGDDVARLRGDIDQVSAARADVSAARAELTKARDDLTEAMRAYQTAKANVEPAAAAVIAKSVAWVASKDAVEAIPLVEAQVAEAQVNFADWGVMAAAFHRDGIPTMVIERLLPRIEARANEVLARMPEDMSLRLVTSAVTKAGTISDKLDIVVTHEGAETPFGMLSGAQQFRVNIALRLGQQRVLAARSGASIEFLFLDEADRDLDEEGVEALMETIATIRDEFGLILLISHHAWLTDRVGTRYEFSRVKGETLVQVA